MKRTLSERFWAKVDKSAGCWEWTASCHHQWEYGHFKIDGAVRQAHRVSWEMHNGTIPDGFRVCHKCDNPKCVRPAHLFLGTDGDNARDRETKGRGNAGAHNILKTHCPQGHEYTPENTRVRTADGWRMRFCKECNRIACRAAYRKHRADRRAKAVVRTKKRRDADPEKFRVQQRDYMRAHRARKKATSH